MNWIKKVAGILQNLLDESIVDHDGRHLGQRNSRVHGSSSGSSGSTGGRSDWHLAYWLSTFVLENTVQLTTTATILPVAGRLASFALDFHVAQRTLTIEAVFLLPQLTSLFMAQCRRFMSKTKPNSVSLPWILTSPISPVLAVQALVARWVVKEVTIVEIFRKFHFENLLLTCNVQKRSKLAEY